MKRFHALVAMMSVLAATSLVMAGGIGFGGGGNGGAPRGGAKEKPADTGAAEKTAVVVRYVKHVKAKVGGKEMYALLVMSLNNKAVRLALKNRDEVSTEATPDTDLLATLEKCKEGDFIEIEVGTEKVAGMVTLESASPFVPKAGEDEPNVYLFVQQTDEEINKRTVPVLKVTKFGQEFTFMIPAKRDKEGNMVANEAMMQTIGELSADDPVEIVMAGKMIRTIKKWELPKRGEFVKLVKPKTGPQQVQIKDNEGAELTLSVKAKGDIWRRIRQLKENDPILYRAITDDKGKVLLLDIKPAPADEGLGTDEKDGGTDNTATDDNKPSKTKPKKKPAKGGLLD